MASKFQGFVEYGGQTVSTAGFTSTTKVQRSYTGATVTVYLTGTVTLATIYSDASSTPKANPFTADSAGFWFFWGDLAAYDIRFSGGGITTPFTLSNVGSSGTSAALGAVDVASYATRGDGANAIVTGTGTVSVTNGLASVTGTGTAFTTELAVGDVLKIGGVDDLLVQAIGGDTSLTLHKVYSGVTNTYAFTYRAPWGGWTTPLPKTSNTAYYFRQGKFVTSQLSMRDLTRYRLYGAGPGPTQLIGTGAGATINIGANSPTTFGVIIEDMEICSTGLATNGIELESTHHSVFSNLKIRDFTNAYIYHDFGVLNTFLDLRLTGLDGDLSTRPDYGIYFACLDPANVTGTMATVIGGHYGATDVAAIWLEKMSGAEFINVGIEANYGRGMYVSSGSVRTKLKGVHFENNGITTGDPDLEFVASGYSHSVDNIFADREVIVAANRTTVINSAINKLTVSGAYNVIIGNLHTLNGSGAFNDTGTSTIKLYNAPAATQIPALSIFPQLAFEDQNRALTDTQNLSIRSTDSFAIDKGGSLGLVGKYNTAGSFANFGGIASRKENATDGNILGYTDVLVQGGSGMVAAIRCDSNRVPTFLSDDRVTAQFDKTNDTLANITGLSVPVLAGKVYEFEAILRTTSDVAAGVKFAIGGTATATAIVYDALVWNAAALSAQTRATALGAAVGGVTAVTVAYAVITGTITVNAAGTLTVQFAQNVTNAAASSVLVGSVFKVRGLS